MGKMTKYQKARLILNSALAVPITTGVILASMGVGSMWNDATDLPLNLPTRLENSSAVDMSSYHSNVSNQSDKLYEQLRNGEITINKFKSEYEKLTSEDSIISWARESEDPAVQEIVTEYDQDLVEQDASAKDIVTKFGVGMGIIAGSAVSSVLLEEYLRKKYSSHTVNNQDLNGQQPKPSAMNIDDPTSSTTTKRFPDMTMLDDEDELNAFYQK